MTRHPRPDLIRPPLTLNRVLWLWCAPIAIGAALGSFLGGW